MKISVQREDFSIDDEIKLLRSNNNNVGAIVTFTGLVREMDEGHQIEALTLEHYPGMTESSLEAIVQEAEQRWPLLDVTVIHRVGELLSSEHIVLVVVLALHRESAFFACEFIMDYLKTRAPFWKKSRDESGEKWVEAKISDEEASRKW